MDGHVETRPNRAPARVLDGVIENARIVTPDEIIDGWVAVEDGTIREIGAGRAPERGHDLGGDLLIPGLIELHTDNLERHYSPRPEVFWHPLASVLAYDAEITASGITTVFDSLRAGLDFDGRGMGRELMTLGDAVADARAKGLLRVEHLIHLRCEVPAADVLESAGAFASRHQVHLMSLMDHTPGFRQFRDIAKYLVYYGGRSGKSESEIRDIIRLRQETNGARAVVNRPALVAMAKEKGIRLASHDDTTLDNVAESVTDGVALAEFPTTIEAARACHEHGIAIMMGAPNLIRGGSHSGNIAAEDLARDGLLDVFSSDYVPASLLMAAFRLPKRVPTISLPQAIRTVTLNSARAAGLEDRGAIAAGQRADLVRVTEAGDIAVVREVYNRGARVL